MQEVASQSLPAGYQIAWTGSAFQELATGGTGSQALIFGTAADIEAYYRRYLDLAASLRGKGFEPGRADAAHDPFVGVAIDGSGAVVHCQKGHHRFALAREQGIGSVPVKVRMVHTEWLRGNLAGSGSPHRRLIATLRRHFEETRHA